MIDSKRTPWQLVEQGGQQKSMSLPQKGTLIIGSSGERADFQLDGQGLEASHCAIGCVKSGGWAIKDLGSQFGTFLNGEKVQSKRLNLGDVIVLGSVRLEVLEEGAKSSPTANEAPAASLIEELPSPVPKPVSKSTRKLAGYQIESTLGKGGMGEVVLALQESLNRHVAIKLLSKKLGSDREFVQAFHSEARSAAALTHSNVVIVHDVGEEAGQHYLTMEYMPGGSLEDRVVKEGRLPWREVLNILHDAAAGLSYAESQGIVHRDIKPANLMLASSGAVKIADLGLALNVNEQGAGDSAEGRKTFGTPHFISPEQARGLAVDQRSDLYSLGATAYRLLSGRTPFQGETTREIVRARFVSDPPPLINSVPDMPEGLHQLVHKLMQREPDKRFATARELLSAVDLLRLRADHGGADEKPARAPVRKSSKAPLIIVTIALLGVLGFFLTRGDDPKDAQSAGDGGGDGTSTASSPQGDRGNQVGSSDSGNFFGNGQDASQDQSSEDDIEQGLAALESQAITEYAHIPSDLSVKERIVELEALATRFDGTDSAGLATKEAERLRKSSLAAENAASSRAEMLRQTLDALKTSIGWPQPETNPANLDTLLQRLYSYVPPADLGADPNYRAGLLALRDEIISTLQAKAMAAIAAGEELADKGNFEPLRSALISANKQLWPGEASPGEAAIRGELRETCLGFEKRLVGINGAKLQYEADLISSDRARLAACLGPGSALRSELLNLTLEPALARTQSTAASLATDAAREELKQAAEFIVAAQRALGLIQNTHAAGLWKRDAVVVPKGNNRSTSKDAVSTAPEGILVADEGKTRLVTWGEFAQTENGLAQLFKSRLTRPWTPDEAGDIACLLSLPALAKALDLAGDGLLTSSQLPLSPRVQAAMLSSFDQVIEWVEAETGEPIFAFAQAASNSADLAAPEQAYLRIVREREAMQALGQALVAYQEGSLSLCVSLIETLLEEYAQSLVVLMLSSGTP